MQKRRTIPCGILLLGVLSAVFGYEDFESIGIESASLERTCQEYPELFGCEHQNSYGKIRKKREVDENGGEEEQSGFYFPENQLDAEKRFGNYRIRNSETEGYKRGPGFRSWGGKRSGKGSKFSNWGGKRAETSKGSKFSNWGGKRSDGQELEQLFPEDKRAKFGSWGGKRNGDDRDFLFEPEDKRAKFGSWGGKRVKFASWGGKRDLFQEEEKRAKFGSWGGKRTAPFPDFPDDKRAKFGSWGGKRSFEDLETETETEKRAKFGSWGGKRSDEDPDQEKRAKFGSWGGKRFDLDDSAEKKDLEYPLLYDDFQVQDISKRPRFANPEGKRTTFRSWGGKRAVFGSAPQKNPFLYIRRGDLRKFLNWGGKRKFSSWGGKRSAPEGGEDSALDLEKRPSFNSWGGKRSETNSSEIPLTDYNLENLVNESNNSAEYTATKEMAALSRVNPYYPIVNKRSYYPGRQSSIKTLLLNDVYDTRGTDLGTRRRSEFFPWGGKRDQNKTLR